MKELIFARKSFSLARLPSLVSTKVDLHPIFIGFGIAFGQLLFVLIVGLVARRGLLEEKERSLGATYRALASWDSNWYWSIAELGYYVPKTLTPKDFGNVAFFPGYPLTARTVNGLTGLPMPYALLLVSQLSCGLLWTYLLLLLRRHEIPGRAQILFLALLLFHPAAYFLVAGYSESLFLASFLGMCYWAGRPGWLAFVLAAAHGFMMTSTRIVGLPLIVVPFIAAWFTLGVTRRVIWRSAALAGLASLGLLIFFAWCHVQFGRWDSYFAVEKAGWGVQPNYWVLFYRRLYSFKLKYLGWALNTPGPFDHTMAILSVVLIYLMVFSEVIRWWFGDQSWRRRIPWYFAAAGLVYVPLAGHFNRNYGSFTRFSLVSTVPFLILASDAFRTNWRRWLIPVAVLAAAGIAYQLHFTQNYLLGRWTF